MLELIKAFDDRAQFAPKYEDINSIYKEGIEIITDSNDLMSQIDPNSDAYFTIKGPYGIGIITEMCKDGEIIGICYNQTISCFIDLAAFILRKNLYKAGKVLKKQYKLISNENLDKLDGENFKFVLIAIYDNKESVMGREICVATERIATEFMFGNFEYVEYIDNKGTMEEDLKQIFDSKFNHSVAKLVCAAPGNIVERVKLSASIADIKPSNLVYL